MEYAPDTVRPQRRRLMIVDDQLSIRDMLNEFISLQPDFEVVAQAATVAEAIMQACQHAPEVIVLDWVFPGGGGAEFLRLMRTHELKANVIVLSGQISNEVARTARAEGALGFFEKNGNLREFLGALRVVAAGGEFPPASRSVLTRAEDARESVAAGGDLEPALVGAG